jgi:hypothetical protein
MFAALKGTGALAPVGALTFGAAPAELLYNSVARFKTADLSIPAFLPIPNAGKAPV